MSTGSSHLSPANNAPLSRLGADVILSIFKTCVDANLSGGLIGALEDTAATSRFLPSYWTSPFLLSAVCRQWRQLCLANSVLWDTICLWFNQDSESGDHHNHVEFALKLWIERSGTRPLKILLGINKVDFQLHLSPGIPEIFAKHTGRITHLELTLPTEWYPAVAGMRFPLLERANLHVWEIAYDWAGEYPSDVSQWQQLTSTTIDLGVGSPKLTSIRIVGMPTRVSSINLPWAQMTEIEISHLVPGDCLRVLELMPNLVSCALAIVSVFDPCADHDGEEWPEDMDDVVPTKRMPRLETLSLTNMLPGYMETILGCIEAKKLKTIHLGRLLQIAYDVYEMPYDPLDPAPYAFILETMPDRFGAQLHTLTLDGAIVHFQVLSDLLPLLPNLVTLKIDLGFRTVSQRSFRNPRYADDRLMAFADDPLFFETFLTTLKILPRLETLHITARDLIIGDAAILEFLRFRRHSELGTSIPERRSPNCVKIRDVRLVSVESDMATMQERRSLGQVPMWDIETVKEIQSLFEGGLNFSVRKVKLDQWDQNEDENLLWRWRS